MRDGSLYRRRRCTDRHLFRLGPSGRPLIIPRNRRQRNRSDRCRCPLEIKRLLLRLTKSFFACIKLDPVNLPIEVEGIRHDRPCTAKRDQQVISRQRQRHERAAVGLLRLDADQLKVEADVAAVRSALVNLHRDEVFPVLKFVRVEIRKMSPERSVVVSGSPPSGKLNRQPRARSRTPLHRRHFATATSVHRAGRDRPPRLPGETTW